MKLRLSALLSIAALIGGFVFLPAVGQDKTQEKTKDVIPHAQDKPPGPALSPEDAIKAMKVPDGFTVELVAAEPDIVNPVAMHIDEKGRFWITESLEYPRRSPGPGKDRVKVIEVGDDGKAKKVTTVIEGLNIPSGIAVGHGGVWVGNSPDILFYPIEDFDNLKLGKPQVVVTGFGRDDTHELPNAFTWGPDGYLYGLNGVFNPSHVKQNGKEWKFTCAMWRIHPRTKEFDIFCEGTSNPWGIAFNDNGDAFISACVIDHLWHLTQTGYYIRQGGPYPPFTWPMHSIVKHKHQKAAYCGICWFDSDAYPEEYRKKLYMGNIHGNCINCDMLEKDGSTYFAKPGLLPSPPVLRGRGAGGEGDKAPGSGAKVPASDSNPLTPALSPGVPGEREKKQLGVGPGNDFLVANDAWFMPVAQKVGPDGSMYILDWYDRYHCYQDANRDPKGIDRLKGRLYRVRYKDTPRAAEFNLQKESDEKLVERLESKNIFYRESAQRVLSERLIRARNDGRVPAVGLQMALTKLLLPNADAQSRRHAFWTLCSWPDPINAFGFEDPWLNSWAIRVNSTRTPSKQYLDFVHKQVESNSPDVLLQVAIASRAIEAPLAVPLLLKVLNNCGTDKLIPHIVWQNLHPLLEERSGDFLNQVAKLDLEKSPNVLNLMPRVVDRVLAAKKKDPQALASLVAVLAGSPNSRESCAKVLGMLGAKVQTGELAGDNLKTLEAKLLPVVKKLQNGSNIALALEATFLGAALRDEDSVLAAREILAAAKQPDGARLKSLDSLIAAGDAAVLERVKTILGDSKASPAGFRGAILASLGKLDSPAVAGVVIERYPSLEPELQPKAIELLTERPAWAAQLLAEIEAKKIPPSAVNVNQVRKILAKNDPAMKKQVEAIWGTIRESRNPQREKVVAQMREVIRKTPGDAAKGQLIFKKLCAQCHKLHGEGAEVGPDITGNGRSDYEQLLSNVFDPSLVIGQGYKQTNVVTNDGKVLNGLLVEDSPQRVVLKTQGGKIETIARGNVEEVATIPLSYMPEDVERQLSSQEIADLFALLVLDRPPGDPAARKIPGAPR
jgi:putative membrane-bound dehydrogenase-like protein